MPRTRDLTNMEFGLLSVTERTKRRENGYYVWRCQCKCGKEAYVNTKRLLRGTVRDCGCAGKTTARKGPIAEDLTGQRFGEWKVLQRAENKKGRVMWECECSCGTRRAIFARDLKAGKTTSCRNPVHARLYNRRDLTGQIFGKLTVLYPTDKRDGKGSIYWHCRCECGNQKDITADALIWGNHKSCGCRKKEVQKNIPHTLHRVDGTCLEVLEKRKYRKDNTSGFRGVYKTEKGTFKVAIGFKRKTYYIGTYYSFEEAVHARMEIESLIHDGFLNAYYIWNKKASEDPAWGQQNPLVFEVEKKNGRFHILSNI